MIITEIIHSTAFNKCPRCHEGKVFENNNAYNFSSGLKMKESCSECHLKYEREPGFFYGALYVSYALMAGLFIFWFLFDLFFLHLDPIILTTIVVANILIVFPLVFRSARISWLNFFIRFDKKYLKLKSIKLKVNPNN